MTGERADWLDFSGPVCPVDRAIFFSRPYYAHSSAYQPKPTAKRTTSQHTVTYTMRISILSLIASFPFFTQSLPTASECQSEGVITIEGCEMGGGDATNVAFPTVYGPDNTSESPSHCDYQASPGMWGRGSLLAFYMQAVCNSIDVIFLVDHTASRIATAFVVGPFLLAYLCGFKKSVLALEAPAVSSILTPVIVPLLLQAILCWSWRENTESLVALGFISLFYLLDMTSSVLSVHLWDGVPADCDVFSGLGLGSIKETGIQDFYMFLFCLGILLAISSLAVVTVKPWIHGHRCRVITRLWFRENRLTFYSWLSITAVLFAASIASIEMTMKKHKIALDSLGSDKNAADQWIPFGAGVISVGATIVNLSRHLFSRRSDDTVHTYQMVESVENQPPVMATTIWNGDHRRRLITTVPPNQRIGYIHESSNVDDLRRLKHNSAPTTQKSRVSLSSIRGLRPETYSRKRGCTV